MFMQIPYLAMSTNS